MEKILIIFGVLMRYLMNLKEKHNYFSKKNVEYVSFIFYYAFFEVSPIKLFHYPPLQNHA